MSDSAQFGLICCLPLCVCGFGIILNYTIPLYFLITGIVQIDGCSADYRIPIWMIVFGSFMLVDRILDQLFECCLPKDINGVVIRPRQAEFIVQGINICEIALSIIGLIWTIQVIQSSTIGSCNGFVFWPSFVLSILCVIILSLSVFCFACVCFGLVAAGKYQFTRIRMG